MKQRTTIFYLSVLSLVLFMLFGCLGGGAESAGIDRIRQSNSNGQSNVPISVPKLDNFSKCLTQKGAKMYGAFWCPHCNAQKEAFGSSIQYITYIECSKPDRSGQFDVCTEAGVNGYPTWDFGTGVNGQIVGEATFQQLARKTNCALE